MTLSMSIIFKTNFSSTCPSGKPHTIPIIVSRIISLNIYVFTSLFLKPKTFRVAISLILSEIFTCIRFINTTNASDPAVRIITAMIISSASIIELK